MNRLWLRLRAATARHPLGGALTGRESEGAELKRSGHTMQSRCVWTGQGFRGVVGVAGGWDLGGGRREGRKGERESLEMLSC